MPSAIRRERAGPPAAPGPLLHRPWQAPSGAQTMQAFLAPRPWPGMKACPEYGQIAQALGKPSAARAVGAAEDRNLISNLLACHQVIGRDGASTGYAGGLYREQALLRAEMVQNRWLAPLSAQATQRGPLILRDLP